MGDEPCKENWWWRNELMSMSWERDEWMGVPATRRSRGRRRWKPAAAGGRRRVHVGSPSPQHLRLPSAGQWPRRFLARTTFLLVCHDGGAAVRTPWASNDPPLSLGSRPPAAAEQKQQQQQRHRLCHHDHGDGEAPPPVWCAKLRIASVGC
jgi:hypothetical protein